MVRDFGLNLTARPMAILIGEELESLVMDPGVEVLFQVQLI